MSKLDLCSPRLLSGVFVATVAISLFSISTAFAQHTVPSTGSGTASPTATEWDTKWNLFQWRGKSTQEINDKVNREYAKFIGKTWKGFPAGTEDERFLWDYPGRSDYMLSRWYGDYNGWGLYGRVVIEAQANAMMIAVQMDDKDTFDKLWKFTKEKMQLRYRTGDRLDQIPAFFGWQLGLSSDGTTYILSGGRGDGPAPDGEQFISAALYFAAGRWGNGTGYQNYQAEADDILNYMLNTSTISAELMKNWYVWQNYDDFFTHDDGTAKSNIIKFIPYDDNGTNTDPAYHLPGFYQLFSLCGRPADRVRWAKIAKKTRTYFWPRTCGFDVAGTHPNNTGEFDNGTSHLPPDGADYDGTVHDYNGKKWGAEAWRVGMGLGFDYMWWGDTSNSDFDYERQIAAGIQNTLGSAAGGWRPASQSFPYETDRHLNGVAYWSNPESPYGTHGVGAPSCTAVATLCSNSNLADEFVDELWGLTQPTGAGNKYDQYLYMDSLLMVSGRFRVYMPGGSVTPPPPTTPTFSLSSSISPGTSVSAGTALTLSSTLNCTGGTFTNGKFGLRMYGPTGTEVTGAPTVDPVNISSGQSQGVTWSLSAPTTAGIYTLYAGVWNSDWTNAYPFTSLGTITVGSGSTSTVLYDFENGGTTQGWSNQWGGISNVAASTAQKKTGSYSLGFTVTATSGYGFHAIGVSNPAISSSQTIKTWVWVPSSLQLNAVEVQIRNTSGQMVGSSSLATGSITRDNWNLMTTTVSASAGTVNQLVVQFDTTGASTGTAYIDCVSKE